jgi:hypothetical protein
VPRASCSLALGLLLLAGSGVAGCAARSTTNVRRVQPTKVSTPPPASPKTDAAPTPAPPTWALTPDGVTVEGRTVHAGPGRLNVVIRGPAPVSERATVIWVQRAAQMLIGYFGRFSVPSLKVEVRGGRWGDVGFGQHFGGRRLEIDAGQGTSIDDLETDWVMVHEMLHTAYPRLHGNHRWMREGLSTYLESMVRAEAGIHAEEDVWRRWVRQMPQGVPGRGDRGLVDERSWSSIYWGGALFWLIADVRLRVATDGKLSLKDALRPVLAAGGSGRVQWPVARALKISDEATGTTVLSDLYDEMGLRRASVDLDELFAKLGVRHRGGRLLGFDNDAPWAGLRRAMTTQTHDVAPLVR